jgi:hypothetical protein
MSAWQPIESAPLCWKMADIVAAGFVPIGRSYQGETVPLHVGLDIAQDFNVHPSDLSAFRTALGIWKFFKKKGSRTYVDPGPILPPPPGTPVAPAQEGGV